MASIHGKKIGGQTYYYLREVARVDGKPKVVSQRYLGKAADIVAAMDGAATLPERTSHRRFGDVAAVWGMCQQLQVAEVVDEVVGERRADASASVGTYLALATVNRIVDPCSKRAFADWWDTTAGPRFVRPRLPAGATDHRRFWDAMDTLTDEHLAEIERRLSLAAVETSDHPELLAIPHSAFHQIDPDRFEGVSAHDTVVEALGVTRRAIITHSSSFHQRQARGFDQTLAKARRQLSELQARLARSRTRKSMAAVQTEIDRILAPRRLNRVIKVSLTGDTPATRRLTWRTDARARARLEAEIFGKRILFTNRHDWTIVDVIAAYRTQPDVEASFRQMKDPHVVSFSPMHHWTEQKIKVHAFYCVLALQIAHLMRRHTRHAGLDLSVRGLLAELAGIEETVLIYPSTGGRPKARRMLTDTTPTQQRLYDLFDLHRYAPTT